MTKFLKHWLPASLLLAASIASASQVKVPRNDGEPLVLIPLTDNAIRVKIKGESAHEPAEMIYLKKLWGQTEPAGTYRSEGDIITLKLAQISASYNMATDRLCFLNAAGDTVLSEVVGGRTLTPSEVQGEATTIAGQRFVTPDGEAQFGTGQFQDGQLNVRGLSRRLTQVNTQISLPFILSNKGYGLLWNNYGMTEFNPPEHTLSLTPCDGNGEEVTVDVTTTTGNARETRSINAFEGKLTVDEEGDYALLLDVGRPMARKHKLTLDGRVLVDVNNLWLPPTTSVIAHLTPGEHHVVVEGEKHDAPVLGWRKVGNETEWRSPVSAGIDYTVFAGTPDEVIAGYREATGEVPMLPEWAFGYIHCRERFNTQDELLENAAEFRRREIPVDVMVQDWQYWGKHGWNAMRFDEERYPDPRAMVDSLHAMEMRLMLSVWAKLDVNSELGAIARDKGYLVPGTEWVDFFNPEAAKFYSENSRDRLASPFGIDAWWQDATEPENDDLTGRRIAGGTLPGEIYRNAFPLFVNYTVFRGLRAHDPSRRVMILTRSAFPGIQRYGVSTWSGDVGWDLPTLRRQIIGGLGQMAAGVPLWTYDAGGFFRPADQYTNEDYHQVFLRWLQCSVYLPLMRVHGYMSNTEPWRYGQRVDSLARRCIEERYRLLPYIYSGMARVSREGYTMMRPLVMDFPGDAEALKQECSFMFGSSMLVAPVTEADITEMKVYLPAGTDWYDYRDGTLHHGGAYITAAITDDAIPVLVKAGAIIPMAEGKQFAADRRNEPLRLHLYPGADGSFTLYEDEGDNTNCEKGAFSTIRFTWDDARRTLTVADRQGSFPGMPESRTFIVVLPDGTTHTLPYSGCAAQLTIDK